MKFIADLHIHSKYSRATSKNLNFENLYIAALFKGVTVLGTGDFTHPGWFSEIKEILVEAEPGLFKLKKDLEETLKSQIPERLLSEVRFLLSVEISSIYKKRGKTRKNHNLVFMPDIKSAENFRKKLSKIGNISSDGRPIIGMDSKHLLEMVLETCEEALFVPAHIWTPWFSLFGSKSGFDSIKECFEDLSCHIKAAETGLSSDPPMNWRVSELDRIRLISNSDAHSPSKIGREANIFDTDLDYFSIVSAISGNNGFLGTIEFFPEEGKYHLDGHKKCGISCYPSTSLKNGLKCPVCSKKLTLGVLHRVERLADRKDGKTPENALPFYSLVGLKELISEILGVGPGSKKVERYYFEMIRNNGSELDILMNINPSDLDCSAIPLLKEAILRVRKGEVSAVGGYDGQYGTIKVFEKDELEYLRGQFSIFPEKKRRQKKQKTDNIKEFQEESNIKEYSFSPNHEQRIAVEGNFKRLMVQAGPGTGKTMTLVMKIADLVNNKGVNPKKIMALTFTNKAADEMKKRLSKDLKDKADLLKIGTFHSICRDILVELKGENIKILIDEKEREEYVKKAVVRCLGYKKGLMAKELSKKIEAAKQSLLNHTDNLSSVVEKDDEIDDFRSVYSEYQKITEGSGLYDFDDLIFKTVISLRSDHEFKKKVTSSFRYLLVDEYQDINYAQYCLIREFEDSDLFVIGDSNQAIYGFRGSDPVYFDRFDKDFPGAERIIFTKNYRSSEKILEAAYRVIGKGDESEDRVFPVVKKKGQISLIEAYTPRQEAVLVGKKIEDLMGGVGLHSIYFGKTSGEYSNTVFSDIAVLYRTNRQGKLFAEMFEKAGIPFLIPDRENVKGSVSSLLALARIVSCHSDLLDIERLSDSFEISLTRKTASEFVSWCMDNRFTLGDGMDKAAVFPIKTLTLKQQERLVDFFKKIDEIRKDIEGLNVYQKITRLERFIRVKKRDENNFKRSMEWILSLAENYRGDLASFLRDISLKRDGDISERKVDHIMLLSMHASKGLEFDTVFITGCQQDLIPFKRGDLKEETRLMFVAMTRAKQRLFLSFSVKGKDEIGKNVKNNPSIFIKYIEDLIVRESSFGKKRASQLKLF